MATRQQPTTDHGTLTIGSRSADKVGLIGSIVSAMGCATCFPAIASLGAAIGLGALSPYEGLFIHILLPIFAGIALLANLIAWFRHQRWERGVPTLAGPILVLVAVFVMLVDHEPVLSRWLLYPGLVLMLATSIWDLVNPARRSCRTDARVSGSADSR
ncbi:MAG: organomercurial transporter MerC [Rhodanobacteraceae bacterium]